MDAFARTIELLRTRLNRVRIRLAAKSINTGRDVRKVEVVRNRGHIDVSVGVVPSNEYARFDGRTRGTTELRNHRGMSLKSGWAVVAGGLYASVTSPHRVVLTDKGAETAAQLASIPAQLAATLSTSYSELGTIALPVTCSNPIVLQSW